MYMRKQPGFDKYFRLYIYIFINLLVKLEYKFLKNSNEIINFK